MTDSSRVRCSERVGALGWWLLAAFIVATPMAAWQGGDWSAHDVTRLAQLGLLAACSVVLATRLAGPEWPARPSAMGWCTVGIALAAGWSAVRSPFPGMAWRELGVLLGLCCVAATAATAHDRRLVAATLAATALYSALLALVLALVLASAQPLQPLAVFVGYGNPRMYNHVQTVALPLLAIAACHATRRRVALLAWGALAFGVALLIFTRGRGTMAGLLLGGLAAWAAFGSRAWPVLRVLLGAGLTGLLVYLLVFVVLAPWAGSQPIIDSPGALDQWQSDSARFHLWSLAWDDIRRAPWFGIGPMHFAHHMDDKGAHPHNVYLQVAAEFGVPMLLALLALSAWGLVRLARTVRACGDIEAARVGAGLFVACVAVAVDGLFSGNFVMPMSQVWIALLIGWAWAWTRRNGVQGPAVARRGSRTLGIALALVLLAAQALLWADVWPDIGRLGSSQIGPATTPLGGRNPRFWLYGWF